MNKMTKSEVYSWRLTPALKAELEAAALAQKTNVGSLLEHLARQWLTTRQTSEQEDTEHQRRLHKRARRAIGTVSIDMPSATNAEVRKVMGEILEEKYRASQRRAPRRSD